MAASKEWFEYHLTPRGWELGSNRTDSSAEQRTDPPEDRVLTIRIDERMANTFSKIEGKSEEIWRSKDSSQVNALIDKFGKSPS
jgi:hypothetical protein